MSGIGPEAVLSKPPRLLGNPNGGYKAFQRFPFESHMPKFSGMTSAIQRFLEAHDYCRALENFLLSMADVREPDVLRGELDRAYDELDRNTMALVGAGFAESGGAD